MMRKLPVFILLTLASTAVFGQQAPEPGRQIEQSIIFSRALPGGYLGVQTQEITKENFSKYNLREVRGVAIEKVVKDSPAAQAGLQKGDVILKFNDEEVTSVFKLTRLVGEVAPDHQAKITILRGGSESELTVTLGKRQMPMFSSDGGFSPENIPLPAIPEFRRFPMPGGALPPNGDVFVFRSNGANRQIGIGVVQLTKQLADYFGIADGRGVLIDSVRENSPAARAGLKAGDVIIEADGKEIANNSDLSRAINDKKEGDVSLTFLRDKNRQTVTVTPEVSKNAAMPFGEFQNYDDGQPFRFRMQTPTAPAAPLPPNRVKPAPRIL